MRVVGIIPVRYHSTRLPAKALADIAGKTMVERVYSQAARAGVLEKVIVATDTKRIYKVVRGFGGEVRMTSPRHPSGTDRVAEVASKLKMPGEGIVVNIQGDAPLIPPRMINQLVKPLLDNPDLDMSALYHGIEGYRELFNPNIVKVVIDKEGFALYFSRLPLPYLRDEETFNYFYKHIGPYAYRKSFLLKFSRLPMGRLEEAEKLEQLRVLENGYRIKMVETKYDCIEVDTPRDLEKAREIIKKRGK
ncbi:3-deoxy-manno-octulosonate cytidylyltransferase [candidate division NPL-UPA2 bacterium]|nr:3-deoxy-manno-octulosonate cytidylyltransferase [candidate division NPL-UPA2 bacterium]